MSRNEDYLDNLLTSVTDKLNEFDDDFEQNRESLQQSYQTQDALPPKTQSALDEVREDDFLREFEQEFQANHAEDDFIREFEREIGTDAAGSQPSGVDAQFQPDPDLEEFFKDDFEGDPVLSDLFQDDGQDAAPFDDPMLGDDHTVANTPPFDDFDDMQTVAASFDEEPPVFDDDQTVQAPPMDDANGLDDMQTVAADNDPLAGLGIGEDFFTKMENGEEVTTEIPTGMEGLGDIFGDSPDSGQQEEPAESQPAAQEPQDAAPMMQMDPGLSAEINSDLTEILSESDEEALAELSDILNPPPKEKEDKPPQRKSDDPFSDAPEYGFAEMSDKEKEEPGKKKKKEKNPNSIFAKLSRVLFGTPEELNPELAAEYEAAKAAAGGEPDPKEIKEKKKAEKELKKQQKKEAAELKKQEKDAAKAEKAAQKAAKAASKPKKEKKPKNKAPKEPPLPKVPVIMMWALSLSLMVLILLASSLLGYSVPVRASKEAFESGDYVTAYAKLQGVKVKKADEELFQAASTLAGIQTQLDAYTSLMEQKQYEMALDALIRGAGRCRLHSADAQEWGVSKQLGALETQFHQLLKEQFDVSKRKAKILYKISKRSEYTLELHKILSKLGLYDL